MDTIWTTKPAVISYCGTAILPTSDYQYPIIERWQKERYVPF